MGDIDGEGGAQGKPRRAEKHPWRQTELRDAQEGTGET